MKSVESYAREARVAGVLYIIATGAIVASAPFVGSTDSLDFLTEVAAEENLVVSGTLIQLAWVLAVMFIPVVLYPVLELYSDTGARAFFSLRFTEALLSMVFVVIQLTMVGVSHEFVNGAGDRAAFEASGTVLLEARDWSFAMGRRTGVQPVGPAPELHAAPIEARAAVVVSLGIPRRRAVDDRLVPADLRHRARHPGDLVPADRPPGDGVRGVPHRARLRHDGHHRPPRAGAGRDARRRGTAAVGRVREVTPVWDLGTPDPRFDSTARTTVTAIAQADPRAERRVGRTRGDWIVFAIVVAMGTVETLSPGLGWSALRAVLTGVFAAALLQRRQRPAEVLVVLAVLNISADLALRAAGYSVFLTGITITVAFYAVARWSDGSRLLVGLGVIAAHAVALWAVDPNISVNGVILLHAGPFVLAIAVRPRDDARADRPVARVLRGTTLFVILAWLFSVSQGPFLTDELAGYVTRVRSPDAPDDWFVDSETLAAAAAESRGSHGPDGSVRHTVDYRYQLLEALESPTASIEADVSVIDGQARLQHDPRYAVGMALTDLLEYAVIADIPIIKLDLKRDHVQVVIDEVRDAVDRIGLDPSRVQFNADVFRGPGVENDRFGARTDKSFTDRMYNLLVMELETADLVLVAEQFPDSTIVISAFTPTGPLDKGYSSQHLDQFLRAADEIRAAVPTQRLAFAVRGDLAALADTGFIEGLTAVDNSFVAAWWSADPRPTAAEIEHLRNLGVTNFDLGETAEG